MRHRCVVLSDGARPTEAIYVEAAARELRAAGIALERVDARTARPGRRSAARLFERRLAGSTVVVCRSLAADWIHWLEARRAALRGMVYLVDDDLEAAAACPELPEGYRARMAAAADRQPRLLALADTVVVTSAVLHERVSARHPDVRVLTPRLVAGVPDTAHFARARWLAGFHGTRAHASDLAAIAPGVQRIRAEGLSVDFESLLGRHTPPPLQGCCRIRRPRAWRGYRRFLGKPHLQIGLVPLMAGAFNEAKSWVKFLETAQMGGVGVFSARRPYTEIVEHGVDGWLAGDDPQEWYWAMLWLATHPEEARVMAERAGEKARAIGDPADAAAFWREVL